MNTGAFIHDLLGWIDNNLDSRLDIDTVSRRAGYSKWHLQRIFKEHTGYPLAEYIRAQKLQKSVERLAQSDEPILNVAIALGFDSQQSFNRPAHGVAASAARKRRGYASNQRPYRKKVYARSVNPVAVPTPNILAGGLLPALPHALSKMGVTAGSAALRPAK